MTAETPDYAPHGALDALASRYVSVGDLDWTPAGSPGMDWKILFRDAERGLMTALVRFAPGAVLDLHRHVDIEQTYVLEGSLDDDEGSCGPGDFVWRPKDNCHRAWAPNGALLLAIFQTPNVFLEGPRAGEQLAGREAENA